jgi:hypothetical protein
MGRSYRRYCSGSDILRLSNDAGRACVVDKEVQDEAHDASQMKGIRREPYESEAARSFPAKFAVYGEL